MNSNSTKEVFPILWSKDVAAICDWAVQTLGLTESWRAPGESGVVEHAELNWYGGRISVNIDKGMGMGPSGISLRADDPNIIDQTFQRARAAEANITQGLEESPIAYSFTAVDPDGNQWWVNAESGALDTLRDTTN